MLNICLAFYSQDSMPITTVDILVYSRHRCAVVSRDTVSLSDVNAIGKFDLRILGESIVSAVKLHVRDAIIALHTCRLLQSRSNLWVNLTEDGDLPLEELLLLAHLHLARHIVDESLLGTIIKHILPQLPWRNEILGPDLTQKCNGLAGEMAVRLVEINSSRAELNWVNRRQVIGPRALVIESHCAVALEVAKLEARPRRIDRELLEIDSDAMAMCIRIGKQPGLQHRVRRRFDARGQVGRVERNLLDFGEIVHRILIERELADLGQGKLLLRPDVCKIKHVDALLLPQLLSLLGRHGLNLDRPLGELAALDGLVQVLLGMIR